MIFSKQYLLALFLRGWMLWSRRTCQLLRLGRKAERPVKPNIKIKKATSTLFKKRLEFPELPQTDEIIRTKTTHTRRERSISRLRYQVTDNSRIKNDLHRCRAFVFKAVKRWCNTHKTYHGTQATFPPPPPPGETEARAPPPFHFWRRSVRLQVD